MLTVTRIVSLPLLGSLPPENEVPYYADSSSFALWCVSVPCHAAGSLCLASLPVPVAHLCIEVGSKISLEMM